MTLPFVDPDFRDRFLSRDADGKNWRSEQGSLFPELNGIVRFVSHTDEGQKQTSDSFGFKWNKQRDWGIKPEHTAVLWSILKEMNGWDGPEALRPIMENKIVLDAGCGAGTSLSTYVNWPKHVVAADISNAVDACRQNFGHLDNVSFVQADLNKMPFPDEVFDVIWANGVLHHTPDTRTALVNLTRHLKIGGTMMFYIYLRKAPLREFADDHVRACISGLPAEEGWQRMEALTKVGKSLSDLKARITIEEDVPELGFKKGEYDLQRFVYYNIFKCFWNDNISFDDNVHVNYDWYHPKYSHRQSPEEVHQWLRDLNYEEESFVVSDSGISVVAKRRA